MWSDTDCLHPRKLASQWKNNNFKMYLLLEHYECDVFFIAMLVYCIIEAFSQLPSAKTTAKNWGILYSWPHQRENGIFWIYLPARMQSSLPELLYFQQGILLNLWLPHGFPRKPWVRELHKVAPLHCVLTTIALGWMIFREGGVQCLPYFFWDQRIHAFFVLAGWRPRGTTPSKVWPVLDKEELQVWPRFYGYSTNPPTNLSRETNG